MRIMMILMVLVSSTLHAQQYCYDQNRWTIDKNMLITGGLVFAGGAARGFNETLQFNYKIFEKTFPGLNRQWFDPRVSWRNKYEGGNPDNGPRFFLSTTVLVMFTDQYHLNNFIQRAAIVSALIIKIGEGKKPFKHYLFDMAFYSACYSAGFAATYYPFSSRKY